MSEYSSRRPRRREESYAYWTFEDIEDFCDFTLQLSEDLAGPVRDKTRSFSSYPIPITGWLYDLQDHLDHLVRSNTRLPQGAEEAVDRAIRHTDELLHPGRHSWWRGLLPG